MKDEVRINIIATGFDMKASIPQKNRLKFKTADLWSGGFDKVIEIPSFLRNNRFETESRRKEGLGNQYQKLNALNYVIK